MRRPEDWFAPDNDRLAHIQQVIRTAQAIEARRSFAGRLIAAATYHDIGYAPSLATTGFHPVDGAETARKDGFDGEIVDAVLHHSGARGLASRSRPDLMHMYGPDCRMTETALSRALTFCDNRSGPRGESLSLAARIADIRVRHAGNAAILDTTEAYLPVFEAIDAEFAPLLD